MANEELKDKLRESIASGYKRDEIEIIKKNSSGIDRYSLNKELRVCAYCRVSTDNIEQTTSYEFQRQWNYASFLIFLLKCIKGV